MYEMKRVRVEYPEKSYLTDSGYKSEVTKVVREKIYEVETYPIFIRFFLLEEIIRDVSDLSMKGIKEYLSRYDYSVNSSTKLIPYSRTCKLKEVQADIQNHYKQINVKSRLWVYFGGEFKIANNESTIDTEIISDLGIAVLEINLNNSWISEDLEKEALRKNNTVVRDESRNLLGIVNIGNSKLKH